MKKIITYLIILAFGSNAALAQPGLLVYSNGKPQYEIYTLDNAGIETKAAGILQKYLNQASGSNFNITQAKEGQEILVLTHQHAKELFADVAKINLDEDGVLIKAVSGNILITGGNGTGLTNAVYEFLEKYIGCRYYAENAVYIPKKTTISISSTLNYVYVPVIKYRYINYSEAFKGSYSEWNKLTNPSGNPNSIKMPEWGLWVHSLFNLVSPDTYFKDHPEYFALIDGKRVKEQLCLTNKEVLEIAIASLKKVIDANPSARFFSVSQMDNNEYCQCDKCSAIAGAEESQSGPILNFVNQVAAKFPDKIISTLAYNYSRKAPKSIVPAKNVNIFFCATGVNRAIAFSQDKSAASVYTDLMQWKNKTSNIFFWDYMVDFRHLYMPFPTYHTLKPNIKLLAQNNIPYTFLQGWVFASTEMSELRCWLLAKLLWNPDIDVIAASKEFLDYYYGPGGKYVAQYLQALTASVKNIPGITLTNSDNPLDHVNDFLSLKQLNLYKQFFKQAEDAVSNADAVYKKRLSNAKQPIRYATLEVQAKQDNTTANNNYYTEQLNEFTNTAKEEKQDLLDEGTVRLDEYYKENSAYIKERKKNNIATGATAKIIEPSGYTTKTNLTSLFDGISGNKVSDSKWVAFEKNYVELVIDLGQAKTFSNISMRFIHDPVFLTQLPSSVSFATSNDNNSFTDIGVVKNSWPGMGVKKEVKTFEFIATSPVQARYIKVSMRMVNFSMYKNLVKPQGMLCDEIAFQ